MSQSSSLCFQIPDADTFKVCGLSERSVPAAQPADGSDYTDSESKTGLDWRRQVCFFTHHAFEGIVQQRYKCIYSYAPYRVLTPLMICISALASPQLRDALFKKADSLLDRMNPLHFNNPRRVVQFIRNVKPIPRPLLGKCNHLLLQNVPRMDVENISIILGLYHSMQYNNCDFRLAARQRLMELVDTCTAPATFTKLFASLGPMASQGVREGWARERIP